MKRILLFLFVLLLSLSYMYSISLMMIDMDSPIYDDVEALYIIEGKASPMGAKPWSEVDVKHLLDRVTPRTEMGILLKNKITSELSESQKEVQFHFSASINPQIMLHTDKSNFNVTERISSSKKLDSSILNLGLGFSYSDNMALFMNIDLGTYISDIERLSYECELINYGNPQYKGKSLYSTFISNIPFSMDDFNIMNFPNRAYFTAGFDAFRVYAGRDRMEWGNGIMGNMLLGDTLPFHDMLSLTFTGSKWFHYQMLVDFYAPFINFKTTYDRYPLKGIRFLLGHRFEFSFFSGKFIFSLTDAVMYESDDMYIDPRILNPMSFLHNGFIAGNSNSLAVIEFEYAPINNFSIYGQLGIDDIAIFGEPAPPEKDSTANSIGAMFGLRFMAPVNDNGYFHGNTELVYTSPFLYHRAKGDGSLGGYDFSFISSIRYKDSHGISGIFRYLSFPFGSDAISSLLSFGYKQPGKFDITGNLFVMAHGVIDKFSNTRWYQDGDSLGGNTPSTSNPFDKEEIGKIEYTFSFGFDGEYSPLSWLDFNMGIYFITIANLGNETGKNGSDIQFSLGAKIHY